MRVLLGFGLVFSFLISSTAIPKRDDDQQKERYKNLELFQRVLHYVEQNYVDDVKNQELIYGAIKGML